MHNANLVSEPRNRVRPSTQCEKGDRCIIRMLIYATALGTVAKHTRLLMQRPRATAKEAGPRDPDEKFVRFEVPWYVFNVRSGAWKMRSKWVRVQGRAVILRRVVFHILQNAEGLWEVVRDGVGEPVCSHPEHQDAIDAGKSLARDHKAKLVIHDEQGAIVKECTYGYKCWSCSSPAKD